MRTALLLLLFAPFAPAFAESPELRYLAHVVCPRLPESRELDPIRVVNAFFRWRRTADPYYRGEPGDICGNLAQAACSEEENPGAPGSTLPLADKDTLRLKLANEQYLLRGFAKEWDELPEIERNLPRKEYVLRRYYEHHKFEKLFDEADATLEKTRKSLRRFLEKRLPGDEKIQATLSEFDAMKIQRDIDRDPDLLFRPGANILRGSHRLVYGGMTLRFVRNPGSLIFFNGHELGHSLEGPGREAWKSVKSCLKEQMPADRRYDVSEAFGDWMGAQTLAQYLEDHPELSVAEKHRLVKGAARYFCGYGGAVGGHPDGDFRIRMLESHPVIRRALCGESPTEPPPLLHCE